MYIFLLSVAISGIALVHGMLPEPSQETASMDIMTQLARDIDRTDVITDLAAVRALRPVTADFSPVAGLVELPQAAALSDGSYKELKKQEMALLSTWPPDQARLAAVRREIQRVWAANKKRAPKD